MIINGVDHGLPQKCPVVGSYEDASFIQCPMWNQWYHRQPSVRAFEDYGADIVYHQNGPTMQCYPRRDDHVTYPMRRQYPVAPPPPPPPPPPPLPPPLYHHPQRVMIRRPIVTDLPCNQNAEPWNYNTCFDVDGQPCRYTTVVDLEDFMNNEKRKEKSRVAARCRRTKEMQLFADLTAALPARREEVEQLDKASIMRLAISYLRVREVVKILPGVTSTEETPKSVSELSSELSYMKALDGFVLVLSQQGDIVYCSENITEHLGVSQMEIMGQSIFEFSHPCDHDEIREALRPATKGGVGSRRDLLLRLKCTITNKGRNVHLKSASYKVIRLTGHMLTLDGESNDVEKNKKDQDDETKDGEEKKLLNTGSLVAVGRPIPHPANIEIPLDSKTFLSKHNLDMKFTYTDDSLQNTLGFEPTDLVGQSLYDYHHAADSASLAQQFKSLFSKGQCETGQYRFLAKSGGFAWVQTQATVIMDKQQKPTSIVCVNYVVSGIECKDDVFAAHQLRHADLKPSVERAEPVSAPREAAVALAPPEGARPKPATELIFAPRTKDMNKGFLTFSQDEGLTMLKDEPEDLTHLAPTAGDACIPLENSPFDMFDEFILNDNYCSLLGDDLANGSPVDSFTADSLLLSSPEPQESESSCERTSLLTELSLDAFDSPRSDNDIEDGKSPFIPSSDEMPVLTPAVMWGALPDSVSLARPQPSEAQSSPTPALQRLLAAPPTGPPPQDIITNIYSDQGLIPSRTVSSWDTGVKRVLKQEEEPKAKRAKRDPTPPPATKSGPSSSVLMNLLDMQQLPPQLLHPKMHANNYRMVIASPPPNPLIQNMNSVHTKLSPRHVMIRPPYQPNNPVIMSPSNLNLTSPLNVNVGSPMYSLPSSPNYSPIMSPAQRERLLSPYSTPPQSLSPISNYCSNKPPPNRGLQTTKDPFLTNKMQVSPGLPQPQRSDVDALLDPTIETPDFWMGSEFLQGTADLLTALELA